MSIYKKIPAIMSEVGAIEKTRKNTQGSGYNFRGIDDVYFVMQPLLAKHGVFYSPMVVSETREQRESKSGGTLIYTILRVEFTFYADDGSSFKCCTVGEAMDSGDKSSNKAMSAALKYALLQVFCIPTAEDKDTENHTHEVGPRHLQTGEITTLTGTDFASEAQVKRLTAIQLKAGMPDETLKQFAIARGIKSRTEIPEGKYQELCTAVENWKQQ